MIKKKYAITILVLFAFCIAMVWKYDRVGFHLKAMFGELNFSGSRQTENTPVSAEVAGGSIQSIVTQGPNSPAVVNGSGTVSINNETNKN